MFWYRILTISKYTKGAEAIEKERKKQSTYTQTYMTKLYQDPKRAKHHRKVRTTAAMRRYNAKQKRLKEQKLNSDSWL